MASDARWAVESVPGKIARYSGATLFAVGGLAAIISGVRLYYEDQIVPLDCAQVSFTAYCSEQTRDSAINQAEALLEVSAGFAAAGLGAFINSSRIDKRVIISTELRHFQQQEVLLLTNRGEELRPPRIENIPQTDN